VTSEKTPPKGRAVGVIKSLGSRLKSEERAPYEAKEHDDTINFDDPTDDLILANSDSDESKS
jgi:hypothetical protein